MLGKSATGFVVGALGLLALQCAAADKTPEKGAGLDRKPVRCVWLPQLREIKIVDNGTLLFYMRSGGVYRNSLKDKCSGLTRSSGISYQVTTMHLCQADMVNAFDPFAVVQPLPCRLGQFVPIAPLEAKDMLVGPKGALALRNEVRVEEVKLPPDHAGSAAQQGQSAAPAGADADRASDKDAKTPEPGTAANQPD